MRNDIASSAFASINQNKSANAILLHIKQSLESEVGNCIDFTNAILKNEKKLKADQECIIA